MAMKSGTGLAKDIDLRVSRQQAFFSRKTLPGLLVFISENPPRPEQPACTSVMQQVNAFIAANKGRLPDQRHTETIVTRAVSEFRAYWRWRSETISDDAIPSLPLHFDIGIQTAVMTGLEPVFLSNLWWLEPNLGWDAIDGLKFNPDNRWFEMFLNLNHSLWKHWAQDYFFLPFLHRSPLDAANGIRGTGLFEEMITSPERVKRLVDRCVDCQLEIERLVYSCAEGPEEWGIGHMNVWLPKRAVWVNGDPVTMISRDMMKEFEQPCTGRLFSSTGGGFFHNHTKGLFQVDQVARTPGIILQHFNADPNCPRVSEVLSADPIQRDHILDASRRTPIYVDQVSYAEWRTMWPLITGGRFMLEVVCSPEETEDVLAGLRGFRTL